jgi:sigma-B regulation protein RsbU (phosphoserine phosphatase)
MVEAGQFTETAPLLETVGRRIAETLHVDNMAMLLRCGDGFRLQTAVGVDVPAGLTLGGSANSINAMTRRRGPATVYFDRPESWLLDATPAERELLRELNVEVLLPLPGRGRLMGVLALGPKRSEQPYSKSDLQLLTSVGTQTGLALENSELIQTLKVELAQSARMNRELEIAREVQERLFPQSFPQLPGVQVAGACRPAQGVGGDYYDCMITGNGKLGLAIGDVSGKGISAALLMASLRAGLRGQTMQGATNLAQIVTNINSLLYDSSASNRYATFFFAEYDPATCTICYVNAGHNPPLLLRPLPNGSCERHMLADGGGPVVGLMPNAEYVQCQFQMRTGDLLLLYTDGISEAMDPTEEEWGEARMADQTERLAAGSAQEVLNGLVIAADAFASGAPQHDDMTLLVMKLAWL